MTTPSKELSTEERIHQAAEHTARNSAYINYLEGLGYKREQLSGHASHTEYASQKGFAGLEGLLAWRHPSKDLTDYVLLADGRIEEGRLTTCGHSFALIEL